VQNIELLNRQRMDRPAAERPRLTLCMVLMRSNVHELPLFVELAARLSVEGVAAWPVIPVTPEGRADKFDAVHAAPFLAAAHARARALGVALDLPFERTLTGAPDPHNARTESLRRLAELEARAPATSAAANRRHFCHMPTVALYVFWDGPRVPLREPGSTPGAAARKPRATELRRDLERATLPKSARGTRARRRAGRVSPLSDPAARYRSVPGARRRQRELGSRAMVRSPRSGSARRGITVGSDRATRHVDRCGRRQRTRGRVQQRLDGMLQYAETLEQTARRLEAKVDALEHEKAHAREQLKALESERNQLIPHAATLEADRWHLVRHAATLASERRHLVRHAVTLEGEREHLVRHARNVERVLARIRGHAIYRGLTRIKDLCMAPRPRQESPYIAPWVADGSRAPGQPVATVSDDPLQDAADKHANGAG
jgi:hypothetical protein